MQPTPATTTYQSDSVVGRPTTPPNGGGDEADVAPATATAPNANANANAATTITTHPNVQGSIPVIDLASYSGPNAQSDLARDLRHACERTGFFFLDNHGVPAELVARTFRAARDFFAMPAAEKEHCRATAATKNRGWTPTEAETLDPKHQKTRGDLKEGFYVGREIGADSPMAALPLHGPNAWPRDESRCPGFRSACEDYHAALTGLAKRLLPAVAEAAGAPSPQDFWDAVFGEHGGGGGVGEAAATTGEAEAEGDGDGGAATTTPVVPYSSGPMSFVRLLSYLPEASNAKLGILGCGAHTDWGMLTFLAVSDGAPGLQVLVRSHEPPLDPEEEEKEGEYSGPRGGSTYWAEVPPRPGSFVVNVGDMLERWTGGRLRSTVHRVVVPSGEAAAGRRRQSIAFFLDPSFSALIKPAGGGPAIRDYPPVRAGEYLLQRYAATHAGFRVEASGDEDEDEDEDEGA